MTGFLCSSKKSWTNYFNWSS